MSDRISELPVASEAIAGNDLVAVTNVSQPGTGETQKFTQDQLLASQLKLNLRTATELTIATGAITKTQSWHTVDTESDAASDDLDTINGLSDGDVIFFRSNHTDRTVVIKNGTGNIICMSGADISLDSTSIFAFGIYDGILSKLLVYSSGGGGSYLENIVEDITPQLGGDLDLNDHGMSVNVEPTDDLDYQGIIATMTVDTNAEGVGAPLFLAADGHLDTADADTVATAPCVALALETGTGSKKVLLMGTLRVDAWNWTIGPGATSLIYLSETVGTLTQTKPTTEDAVVQPVGFALTDDMIMFNPSMVYITHTA